MFVTVVRETTFDAAHCLPQHPGKCKNLHGHTYRLQVGVSGDVNPATGMVLDFGVVDTIMEEEVVRHLDHKNLNEVPIDGFPNYNPTAELMVEWIAIALSTRLSRFEPQLSFVRLYETPNSYAEWRAE